MATETVNITTTLANDSVTNAKLANMTAPAFKGRRTPGVGDPEDLTMNQASTMLESATDPFIRTSAQVVKSTGGNGAADAGKVQEFNTEGQIFGSVENSSTAAVRGQSTGTGYAGYFNGAKGSMTLNGGDAMVEVTSSIFPLNVVQTGAGDIAHFEALSGQGLEVKNDGGLNWTSATGAATTRTGLGLGTLATQSGTFSGTSSGTNTGDQDLSPYQTIAALAADVRAVVLTGISFATSTAITAADSILVAFGKLQAFNNLFTTVGLAIARLANPSAVTFIRMNADNTATARTASEMLTDIGILRTSLTSAFVTNSASFVDVTGMALTVPAGKKAKFTFYVPYSSAATTVGIGLSMTVTGSPLVRHFTRFTPLNATGTPTRAMITTDDAGAVNASTGTASFNYGIEMNGVVVADASPCVVQLRMAVGGTPANITLSAGSVMMATLID